MVILRIVFVIATSHPYWCDLQSEFQASIGLIIFGCLG